MSKVAWKWIVFSLIASSLCVIPLWAEAHVKWFTEVSPEKVTLEQIVSPLFVGFTIGISLCLAVLTQLLPTFNRWQFIKSVDQRLDQFRRHSWAFLRYGLALSLLLQALSGSLLVPEFHINSPFETTAIGLTIVLLVVPYRPLAKIAALVLLGLFVHLTIQAGLFHMLDYGFYLAGVGVLLLEKTRLAKWGFPLLYLGTGLSLCWVALEKWVFPTMAMNIIENHGVPVFGFAPDVFVMIAAFIEFVVGYLLVVGILNRVLSVVLTLIFISTTWLFGWTEVVGHSFIHVILITFIVEGVSFYKPPVQIHKTVVDQMVFVSLNFIFVLATFLLIYLRYA